ncbi:14915_t:CDS:2, partial [Dentiscutata erythropus]
GVLALLSISTAVSQVHPIIGHLFVMISLSFRTNIPTIMGYSNMMVPRLNLNSIKSLWSKVENKLRKRHSRPGNLNKLEKIVKKEWEALSQSYYRHLVE